jgi:type I restriction enzyme M protein
MITGTLKSQIDNIWNAFWAGGISNPMEVIEQMTYLLFIKRLDELHTTREKKANRLKRPIENPVFPEGTNPYSKKNRQYQLLRWSQFKELGDPNEMYEIVSEEVFPFIKGINGENSTYATHMKDARFTIPTPALLVKVVDMIAAVPMEDRDTKGDLYEYMLSKIATAGQNGQFRTPRHIIQMMVELTSPKPSDIICDPACGTAGFLIAAAEYLREHHPEIFTNAEAMKRFNHDTFNGFDFDSTMLRIGSMNMLLHGIENPDIQNRDSLSQDHAGIEEQYTLILANPPFAGSLDYESCSKDLQKIVKTKKTELLFVALFLRLLKAGGRAAVIVPDGVLFGSSKAHKALRKMIVENQKLDAVISMPSGVFRPYAGVSTAVLVFTKTNSGGTDDVWFYDMQADGYSLDDKRTVLDKDKHETNNLPDIVNRWKKLDSEASRKRTEQSFMVPKDEVKDNDYDLSINRYKEIVYEEVQYDPPKKILADLKKMETEIQSGFEELEGMLR